MVNSKLSYIYPWILLTIISSACTACSGIPANSPSYNDAQNTPSGPWKSAVKKVFTANGVKLSKTKVNKNNHYHTFVVSFPHDPRSLATAQYFNHLYARLLVANHWHNYALRDAKDGLKIQVNWNTHTKVMTTIFVPLQNSLPNIE